MISLMGREPMSRIPEIIRRRGEDRPRTPEPSMIRTSSSPIVPYRPSARPRAEGKSKPDRNERTRTNGLKTAMRRRMGWMKKKAVLTGLWAAKVLGLISPKKRTRRVVNRVARRTASFLLGMKDTKTVVATEAAAALTRVFPMRMVASRLSIRATTRRTSRAFFEPRASRDSRV